MLRSSYSLYPDKPFRGFWKRWSPLVVKVVCTAIVFHVVIIMIWLGTSRYNDGSSGTPSHSHREGHPVAFELQGATPQTTTDDRYRDRLSNLGLSDPPSTLSINTENLKYAIFLPTYVEHMDLAVNFLRTLGCLCSDHELVDIYIIVSNSDEATEFRSKLNHKEECGAKLGRWDIPQDKRKADAPTVTVVNMYNILPDMYRGPGVGPNDTSAVLKERGKYQYQSIKKLAPALSFDYDYGLWLDSESIAVRPFSIRETFDKHVRNPTVWRSRMVADDNMRQLMNNTAKVLGRDIDSFGGLFWNLESVQWIVEKAVIQDMVQYAEQAQGQDFWTAWASHGGPFEILLYNMHIQARKLETVNSIFSKYAVLETEREMIRFGMAPAFPHIEFYEGTGFLERGYLLLAESSTQPNFSAFLRRYGIRLFRFEDLNVAPPEVIDRFLLDSPVDILCSGAPPLFEWWENRQHAVKVR